MIRLLQAVFILMLNVCSLTMAQERENLLVDYETLAFDKAANKAKDLELIKRIRQELVNDMTLSKKGKNVKVIIVDKEITVKGQVETEGEKAKVKNTVSNMANNLKLRDQLEVIRK